MGKIIKEEKQPNGAIIYTVIGNVYCPITGKILIKNHQGRYISGK
jgi:hypothetical protein